MSTLHPKSIALIGASETGRKIGNIILKNVIQSDFSGKVFPVNPKHTQLEGKKCYPTVDSIEPDIDLAVIATPAKTVLSLVKECAKKKVKTVIVISAGFSEMGTEEGKSAEKKMKEIAEEHDMHLIGPNCLGLLVTHIGLNASFAATPRSKGSIGLISQSGAMAVAFLDIADARGVGFSTVISIGNAASTDVSRALELLEDDTHTKVIGLYGESISDGQRFVEVAKRVGKNTPIVLLKAGTTTRGAEAVRSHTGALAGSTAALDAACKEAGIRRAQNTHEFLLLLEALRNRPALPSSSIAILTNAGGPGVLAADACTELKLTLSPLENKTQKKLQTDLPSAASIHNPIDVLGDATDKEYAAALSAIGADKNVEGLLCIVTPQVLTPCEKIANAIISAQKRYPLMPIVTAFMGGKAVTSSHELLREAGVPVTTTPEEAAKVLHALQKNVEEKEWNEMPDDDDRSSAAHGLLKGKRGHLDDSVAQELLSLYTLTMPPQQIATTAQEAAEIARDIGFPVVLKVSSVDALHKTDLGGVKIDLRTKKQVEKAFEDIQKNMNKNAPTAGLEGMMVQAQVATGSEFIVGALRDAAFGPVVMVGLGGIYTELFQDTSFRLAPVSADTAATMLTELTSWKLLLGLRGKEALNIEGLVEAIQKVSMLMNECEDIQEIDLNPVIVDEESVTIADAKVVLA